MENKKILIVDDEKNIRLMLKQCLQGEYEIDIAVNGEEGLSKILSESYELVLLDIKMPGLTGMEVLEKMRQKESNVSVIMMTAYGTIERAVEAMKLGAIDFIGKPFTPEEIRGIVKSVLDRASLNEETLSTFEDYIQYAKRCIVEKQYGKSEEFLKKAIASDVDAPEPHNLLGILLEHERDLGRARNHYRAALALDPSYEPAQKNLSRMTEMRYTTDKMDLGDE